jgi:hypothetical protein
MANLVVAFRSFAKGSDKECKCWTDLSIRRDQRSCKPQFVNPRATVTCLLPGTSGAAVSLDVSVFFSGPPPVADT